MAVKPLWTAPPQYVDSSGNPYSSARLFFYASGSSTKQNIYTDDTGGTAAANPNTLNSSGYPVTSGNVFVPWGTVGETYKIVLAPPGSDDPPNSTIWTADDIAPINDTVVVLDQWVSGPAPTYISATSFSLVGDQTSIFHVGRRLKTTNSGGTIYSTIKTSAFAAATTITVVNDSGTLDAGLSAVSYGLLSATNPSTPLLDDSYPVVSGSADKTKKVRIEADLITTDTTRVLSMGDADFIVRTATQAEQETGTATNVVVTPGIQKSHDSAAKVWVSFDGTAANPITAGDSFGISGTIAKAGTGDYTITFSTNFSTTSYVVVASCTQAALGNIPRTVAPIARTVSNIQITARDATGTASDATFVSVAIFGDQ